MGLDGGMKGLCCNMYIWHGLTDEFGWWNERVRQVWWFDGKDWMVG